MEFEAPLCREKQIQKLKGMLIGEDGISVPQTIFLHGLAATGKSLALKWILQSENIPHAVFHCVELYNVRLMLESILEQLLGKPGRCDNVGEFVSTIRQELEPNQAHVILFEEAARFRDTDAHLKQVFCRLQGLTKLNICCVWESRIDWTKFLPSRGLPAPIIVHFPQFTKPELSELLIRSLPGERSLDFKRDYISLVLSIFHLITRSLSELQHISNLNYTEYCRPVETGECQEGDTKKLWFNIEKPLKRCVSTVHLREVASTQMRELQKAKEEEVKSEIGNQAVSAVGSRNSVELPFYSKFLLISAYLASYNPQRTDKRFFVKHHGKQRKTAQSIKAKERFNSQLTGPKPFQLERMLAIFYNIVEEKVNPTANIYSQISSLARLQLITAVGIDQIDQPKYKCNVTLDFVSGVAKTLKFDIAKYLYSQ